MSKKSVAPKAVTTEPKPLTLADVSIEWGPENRPEEVQRLSSEQLAQIIAYTIARWGSLILDHALAELTAPENIGVSAKQLADHLYELRMKSLEVPDGDGLVLDADGIGVVENAVRDLAARCDAHETNPTCYRVVVQREAQA
jgi:hypothetical protein